MTTTSTTSPLYLTMHAADNVAIVANDGGLPAGTVFACGLTLKDTVPQAHKVALVDIPEGGEVRRYNVTIGHALKALPAGSWVHEGLLKMPAARELHGLPIATVKPPAPAKRLPKALPISDVEAILEAAGAPGTALALRDRALLEVLYGTGARISEAVGLDVDDLDTGGPVGPDGPDGGSVLLRGKGGKQRVVPVGSYALAALQAYLVRARPELVSAASGAALFLNARGGRLSRQSAWTVLVKASERAGVSADVSPHTLRHSFATHLLDGGADVRVVQELLGHASVTTTQVYTLVTVDNLREVFAAAHPRARG